MAARLDGKQGHKCDKLWADALRVAVKRIVDETEDPRPYLAKIAEECVKKAADGDLAAMKEIGDRLDGRPAQTTVLDGDDNAVAVTFEMNVPREVK